MMAIPLALALCNAQSAGAVGTNVVRDRLGIRVGLLDTAVTLRIWLCLNAPGYTRQGDHLNRRILIDQPVRQWVNVGAPGRGYGQEKTGSGPAAILIFDNYRDCRGTDRFGAGMTVTVRLEPLPLKTMFGSGPARVGGAARYRH
jgi:hypothetical protein